jgi:ABC-type uncharacterized transport system auxiliary subunit
LRITERDILLGKIDEWQRKARREQDPFNKYVSIFTAYNIFYNLYKKTKEPTADLTLKDRIRAIEILPLLKANQLFESLKNDLSEYVNFIPIYRDEYWNKTDQVSINAMLAEAFQKGDNERTIEMLVKWLYKVRCNLVHGEKNYDDERQKSLLSMSSRLLEKIVDHGLASYKELCVSGEKRFVFD